MGYEEACVYSTRFVMHGRMALKTEWEEEGIERRWGDVVRVWASASWRRPDVVY